MNNLICPKCKATGGLHYDDCPAILPNVTPPRNIIQTDSGAGASVAGKEDLTTEITKQSAKFIELFSFESAPVYEIFTGSNACFYWRLVASNGKEISRCSEPDGYTSRAGLMRSIEINQSSFLSNIVDLT